MEQAQPVDYRPLTHLEPAELSRVRLRRRLRGYDPTDVDDLLLEVQASYLRLAAERDKLAEMVRSLEHEKQQLEALTRRAPARRWWVSRWPFALPRA